MKKTLLLSATLAAAYAGAVPEITNLTMDQGGDRIVTVAYHLSEPAIVTMEFYTNGVKLANAAVRTVEGEINKLVPAGDKTIRWWPYKDTANGEKVPDGEVKITAWPTNSPPLFMVLNLSANTDNLRFYPSEEALPFAVTDDAFKTDYLLMKRVYAAGREWRMGSPSTEGDRAASTAATAEEAHLVTLTEDYYMGIYEVTERQYYYVTGAYSGSFNTMSGYLGSNELTMLTPAGSMSPNTLRGTMTSGADYDWPLKGHAVHSNSIIQKFRNKAENHVLFDLPTEAQWEYMARAGSPFRFGIPDESANASTNVAWNSVRMNLNVDGKTVKDAKNNILGPTHPVGMLLPNNWGFYDTLGNVGEWCLDWQSPINSGTSVTDPVGPDSGTIRVARGTGFYWGVSLSRCAARGNGWTPDQGRNNHGFRLWASATIK